MHISRAFLAAAALASVLLVSCGRKDASGVFVFADEQQVVLVQLVETPDHRVTGRFEQTSISSRGSVDTVVTAIEGAASDRELTIILKPVSFINSGVTMSGEISGNNLTLVARDFKIIATRSNITRYQSALENLRQRAAKDRAIALTKEARLADEKALVDLAERQAKNAERKAKLEQEISDLGRQISSLNASLSAIPDLRVEAKENTDRIAEMLREYQALSTRDRNALMLKLNQIVRETYQLEIKRNQHRLALNSVAEPTARLADRVKTTCNPPDVSELQPVCSAGMTQATAFNDTFLRGRELFSSLAEGIRDEAEAQRRLINEAREQSYQSEKSDLN